MPFFRSAIAFIALVIGCIGSALSQEAMTSLLGDPIRVPPFNGKSLQVKPPSTYVHAPNLSFIAFLDLTNKKIPKHILVNGMTIRTRPGQSLRPVGTRFLNEDAFANPQLMRELKPIVREVSDRIARAEGYKNFQFNPVGLKGLERLVDESDLQVVLVRYSFVINHEGKQHRLDRPSLITLTSTRRNIPVYLYYYGAPGAETLTKSERDTFIRWVREFKAAN